MNWFKSKHKENETPKKIEKRVALYHDIKKDVLTIKSMAKDQDGVLLEVGETYIINPENQMLIGDFVLKALSNFHVFFRNPRDHSFYPKNYSATLRKNYYIAITQIEGSEILTVRPYKRYHLGSKGSYRQVEGKSIEIPISAIQCELLPAIKKAFEICKENDEW